MITLQQLEERFSSSEGLQREWTAITRSDAWRVVTEIVARRFVEEATPAITAEADAVLSRRLMRQVGALAAIKAMSKITEPKTEAFELPDPWSHIQPPPQS